LRQPSDANAPNQLNKYKRIETEIKYYNKYRKNCKVGCPRSKGGLGKIIFLPVTVYWAKQWSYFRWLLLCYILLTYNGTWPYYSAIWISM